MTRSEKKTHRTSSKQASMKKARVELHRNAHKTFTVSIE